MKGFPGFSLYFLPNKVKDKDVLLGNLVTSIMRRSRTESKKTPGFNEQNDSFALSSHFFVTHFFLNFVVMIFRFIIVIA